MSTHRCFSLTFEALPQPQPEPVIPVSEKTVDLDIQVFLSGTGKSAALPGEPGKHCWHLVSLQRSESQTDSRHDRYYLSRDDGGWTLWNCHRQSLESLDFAAERGYLKLTPTWRLLARCARTDLPFREAGFQLLHAYLAHLRNEEGLDGFHSLPAACPAGAGRSGRLNRNLIFTVS